MSQQRGLSKGLEKEYSSMKAFLSHIALGVTAIGCLTTLCLAHDPTTADNPATKASPAEVSATGPESALEAGVTPEELSKVYMNCLIEVDRTLATLARHAKGRAVQSEAESQRAFCANRKRDCQENPQSAECRTFVEEFIDSGLPEEVTRKR